MDCEIFRDVCVVDVIVIFVSAAVGGIRIHSFWRIDFLILLFSFIWRKVLIVDGVQYCYGAMVFSNIKVDDYGSIVVI